MKELKVREPDIFVIFGSTGDLTYRKLMPALYNLYIQNLLPEKFRVICIGRRDFSQQEYRNNVEKSLEEFSKNTFSSEYFEGFSSVFEYLRLDFVGDKEYLPLKSLIDNLCTNQGYIEDIIYYMAVSPEYFSVIADKLNINGLADRSRGIKRVIIEKPFGEDLKSARELNQKMTDIFTEKEIYRIDHYLGKEMIQNIMTIRFANPILESIWNNRYIDNIQITSNETLGVLTRGKYYEKSGALKDMFQNHMIQLLTLIAMEAPAVLNTEDIRNEKVKVLKAIQEVDEKFVRNNIVRAQYVEDDRNTLKAYRQEDDVDNQSKVDTFIAIKCFINNYRWAGVPFYIRTGKRLNKKITEVVIEFKKAPFVLFNKDNDLHPNLLVIRIHPDERIFLSLSVKKPGNEHEIIPIQMDFCQNCYSKITTEAYEKLMYDAIRGESALFTRWDETEFSWKFVEKISELWKKHDMPLYMYKSLSDGPKEMNDLLHRKNMKWWDI